MNETLGRNGLKYYISVLNLPKVNKDINPLTPCVNRMVRNTVFAAKFVICV